MNKKVKVSAYRIDGENHIPLNVPSVPGIDEQLIAREEATMAIARMRIARRRNAAVNGRKAASQEAAHVQ